jgi:hypothetical protein
MVKATFFDAHIMHNACTTHMLSKIVGIESLRRRSGRRSLARFRAHGAVTGRGETVPAPASWLSVRGQTRIERRFAMTTKLRIALATATAAAALAGAGGAWAFFPFGRAVALYYIPY